jgi:signal transduction histidine kinase
MSFEKLDSQVLLDGLGQGVLIFDSADRLVSDNLAARTILGADIKLIRAEGWKAASSLFNTRLKDPDESVEEIRKRALESPRPVRFNIFRSGEYIPCWASAVHGEGSEVFTLITIEIPDWSAMTELVDRFRKEVEEAVSATQGHTELINQTIRRFKDQDSADQLGKRISGFVRLISTHMYRVGLLMDMLRRLEAIRTDQLPGIIREERRKISLADYMEDFLEELDEIELIDPETDAQDYRARLTTTIADDLKVSASYQHLTGILRDLLRNAIMYSMRATPIKIVAHAEPQGVQIDVIDEGYGVRAKEFERIFAPFQRARQPQIIGEFGYGLSLYLCKQEIEAMNGRIWFQSEEGVGSTFSLILPAWSEETATDSSSASSSSSAQ